MRYAHQGALQVGCKQFTPPSVYRGFLLLHTQYQYSGPSVSLIFANVKDPNTIALLYLLIYRWVFLLEALYFSLLVSFFYLCTNPPQV